MKKFIALNVSHLRLDDLAGLVSETLIVAAPRIPLLSSVGMAIYQTLNTANNMFLSLLNKQRASALTPQIAEKDQERDDLFAEIKRTSKTAQKSSIAANVAAGTKMVETLQPFWDINKEPMMSQTAQIKLFYSRFHSDEAAVSAAEVIGLTPVLEALIAANTVLSKLYNDRLDEIATLEGPSATSVKSAVIAAYDEFCTTVEVTLSALPGEPLQLLFNEINDIRRKYISRLPVPLDEAHTTVEPIPVQPYTGKPVTPLPRVYFQTGKETVELVFAQDFNITYRNNTNVGEAKLFVHGKGKYTGTYDTTFHIAR
ncbi:MAG: DUF6261 family protein [Prevotellaceae bacterium]|jgi:hypothetical protein|nr:DUF6261 family protein [Prevotellaceae bacterium]